jgi:hypothetical protein
MGVADNDNVICILLTSYVWLHVVAASLI